MQLFSLIIHWSSIHEGKTIKGKTMEFKKKKREIILTCKVI